ncbi:MAG TPA: hypothetical protein VF292_02755 [Rhodanobacteraceae bacterium]
MDRSSKKSVSSGTAERAGEEHERLLLDAARVLPEIIRDEVQQTDKLRQRTIDFIEKNHERDTLERWIAEGNITDASEQAAWRVALRNPPVLPLAVARVEFGHSLFSGKRNPSYGAVSRWKDKRLGMVDLSITWEQPRRGRLSLSLEFGCGPAVEGGAASLYELDTVPVQAHIIAFPSTQALGRIMATLEEVDDWVRIDCERRSVKQQPVIAAINRKDVFDAISTTHDVLWIGDSTVEYALDFTRDFANGVVS